MDGAGALLCSVPGPELIQGTFFQPGNLRLTDADFLRRAMYGLGKLTRRSALETVPS